jgi:hypothetical protein
MFVYDHLEPLVGAVVVAGISSHFLARWRQRRRYVALRAACEDAVHVASLRAGDPVAMVRLQELHREFMRAWLPGWLDGLGRHLAGTAKTCAVLMLVAFFFKAPLERREAARQALARSAITIQTERAARAGE